MQGWDAEIKLCASLVFTARDAACCRFCSSVVDSWGLFWGARGLGLESAPQLLPRLPGGPVQALWDRPSREAVGLAVTEGQREAVLPQQF